MSRQAQKSCDECGRKIEKAHRVEGDYAYCSTCYARIFKRRDCLRCGEAARFHKSDEQRICRACHREERTCLRCGCAVPRAYKTVGRSVLCHACSGAFNAVLQSRAEKSPSSFAEFGTRDSGATPKRSRKGYATCSICRRHRKVVLDSSSRKPICRDCIPGQEIWHSCPDCGAQTPGCGLALCRDCGISRRREGRVRLNLELIEQDWCRDLFLAFCDWKGLDQSANNITDRLNRYATFFEQLDQNFSRPDLIDQKGLLVVFEPDGLRRQVVPVRFLIERLNLSWSAARTSEAAETRRIDQILDSCADAGHRQLLADYLRHLDERRNSDALSLRTIRGYLRASSKLLESMQKTDPKKLRQIEIDRFLRRNPGYRASATSFVSYLRQHQASHVRVRKGPKSSSDPFPGLIEDVRVVAQALDADPGIERARALLARLISLLYQVPLEHVLHLKAQALTGGPDGNFALRLAGETVRLEPFVGTMLGRYLFPVQTNDFLFPGRNPGQYLTPSAVWYHVKMLHQS